MLWNQDTVLGATKGISNDMPFVANGVCINTRFIRENNIFIAINGGEVFIEDAFSKGAVAAIVSESADIDVNDKPIIIVKDSYKALIDMGQYKREKTKAKYIAITGSVGKTGTKDMLAEVLSSQGETYATWGNLNNHYGVPLTLANMPETTEFAVIELGMNHAGEISDLVKMVRPDVSLITMIAECHIEFFDSIEDIAEAKTEIFENLSGVAVINRSSPCFDIMYKRAGKYADKIMTFGDTEDCDVKLNSCICHEHGSDIELKIQGNGVVNYYLPISGEHIAVNSCGVFAILKALDLDLEEASRKIKFIKTAEGRGKRTHIFINGKIEIVVIDEAYNASPKAVIASVEKLCLSEQGRNILVLGDMLELGENSKELHLSIIPAIEDSCIDKVYCCGTFMKHVYKALPVELKGAYAENSEDLSFSLEKDLKNNDNILIKGSNGSKMSIIVDFLKGLS